MTKNGVKISVLEQNPILNDNLSILENVFKDSQSFDRDILEYEAKTILNKMGFTNFDLDVKTLSGGEIKRIALAKALVTTTDILILDEPTNHLDNDMIIWLENYLKTFNGSIIMVTHDRYFLDRVTNKILELDEQKLYTYSANYTKFLELKQQRIDNELATKRKNRNLYEKELEWAKRGVRGRGTKSAYRLNRLDDMDTGAIVEKDKIAMSSASTRLGKKTIEVDNISKSYNDRVIVKNFSYIVDRNDRLGIIGKNGMGKSTLLNMLSQTLKPDSGIIEVGDTVKMGVISQHFDEIEPTMRVIDYIKEVAEFVTTDTETISASNMLERFLFDKNKQWSVVAKLSGGEKRRLNLLRVLMSAPNILFLDEPTNDLDILTLAVLEDYLQNFNGAIITVSHDRYFLDKIVTTIFDFNDDGTLKKYTGNYSDFIEKKENINLDLDIAESAVEKSTTDIRVKEKKLKFTFKEQKEWETIESDLAIIENKISDIQKLMEKKSNDYSQLVPLMEEKEALEIELTEKMERWEYLTELYEKINA